MLWRRRKTQRRWRRRNKNGRREWRWRRSRKVERRRHARHRRGRQADRDRKRRPRWDALMHLGRQEFRHLCSSRNACRDPTTSCNERYRTHKALHVSTFAPSQPPRFILRNRNMEQKSLKPKGVIEAFIWEQNLQQRARARTQRGVPAFRGEGPRRYLSRQWPEKRWNNAIRRRFTQGVFATSKVSNMNFCVA